MQSADPVDDLRAAVDEAIDSATTLGTTVAKIERSARGAEALATLARLSVTCGEFVDRLHSTKLDPLNSA